MTTVSMDDTTAEKFSATSFSWGGSHAHIFCTLAGVQPRLGSDHVPNPVVVARRGGTKAR